MNNPIWIHSISEEKERDFFLASLETQTQQLEVGVKPYYEFI